MLVVSLSASLDPACFAAQHSFVVTGVESSADNVVEVSIDRDAAERGVAARHSDSQTCKRQEVRITIFLVNKVQNPFCAALQEHDDDLPESLRADEYQYSAGSVTVASSASGKLSAVNADSMLGDRRK